MLSETKLNALKEISGSFSRDEAVWASGFLAGLAGSSVTVQDISSPAAHAEAVSAKKLPLLTVLKQGTAKSWQ